MSKIEIMDIRPTSNEALMSIQVRQEVPSTNSVTRKLEIAGIVKPKFRYAWDNSFPKALLGSGQKGDDLEVITRMKFKLVVTESTTKENEYSQVKRAGKDGAALTYGGLPIYRKTELMFADDPKAVDTLLKHDTADVEAEVEGESPKA